MYGKCPPREFDVSFDQLIPGPVLPKISDAAEYALLPFDEKTENLLESECADRV